MVDDHRLGAEHRVVAHARLSFAVEDEQVAAGSVVLADPERSGAEEQPQPQREAASPEPDPHSDLDRLQKTIVRRHAFSSTDDYTPIRSRGAAR